ncbi:MAG TPA: pectate lyase, partial [Polyangiaceae bacterium]|nr:pectate lyase [Polyangiaceae bacterium]
MSVPGAAGCSGTPDTPDAGAAVAAAGTAGDSAAGNGGTVGVSAGGSAGSAGSAGAAVVPAVDCSLAGTVPITVAWSAINSQPAEWYASAEALTLADNIVYYQNADKGWPKAVDMTERAQPKDDSTIDNGATTTQIRLLARVFSASGCAVYGDAALDGIGYLLEAQYPNGGWPQYYPDPTG